jgi:hypothetical protein
MGREIYRQRVVEGPAERLINDQFTSTLYWGVSGGGRGVMTPVILPPQAKHPPILPSYSQNE